MSTIWYLGALAALINVPIYRAAFDRHSESEELSKQSFARFRWIALWGGLGCLALGILQTLGGYISPVFPFVIPTRDQPIVGVSWAIVILGNFALSLYINRMDRSVAHNIVRLWMMNLVTGEQALSIWNAVNIIVFGGLVAAAFLL